MIHRAIAAQSCARGHQMQGWLKNKIRLWLARRGYEFQKIRTADWTDEEAASVAAAGNRTMVPSSQIVMLCRCVEYAVRNGVPGALVECGVWRGGSAIAVLHTLLRLRDTSRDIYLYDTFEGMPRPVEQDVCWDGSKASDIHRAHGGTARGSNWVHAGLDDVRSAILGTGYPSERIHVVKGMVEETIPAVAPAQIAILRLDTDFYQSTLHELDHLYPRLAKGGVLIIDDYGNWLGSRKAVDEYIARNNLHLLLVRGDASVRYAVKP